MVCTGTLLHCTLLYCLYFTPINFYKSSVPATVRAIPVLYDIVTIFLKSRNYEHLHLRNSLRPSLIFSFTASVKLVIYFITSQKVRLAAHSKVSSLHIECIHMI
jgi:hypothetical protein